MQPCLIKPTSTCIHPFKIPSILCPPSPILHVAHPSLSTSTGHNSHLIQLHLPLSIPYTPSFIPVYHHSLISTIHPTSIHPIHTLSTSSHSPIYLHPPPSNLTSASHSAISITTFVIIHLHLPFSNCYLTSFTPIASQPVLTHLIYIHSTLPVHPHLHCTKFFSNHCCHAPAYSLPLISLIHFPICSSIHPLFTPIHSPSTTIPSPFIPIHTLPHQDIPSYYQVGSII